MSTIALSAKNGQGRSTHARSGMFAATRRIAMLGTILIIVIVLLLLGALPTWPHSKSWGYFPSGGLGLILLILIILLLLGRL
jgi:hypothetical protein